MLAYVVVGPTTPNQGPTFPSVEATALIASKGSSPVLVMTMLAAPKITM